MLRRLRKRNACSVKILAASFSILLSKAISAASALPCGRGIGRITSVKGLAYLQKRFLLPRMLTWLREATERTSHEPSKDELATIFIQPLTRMANDRRFSLLSRDLATQGLERLESGSWRPRAVLSHKDPGYGNVLIPRDRTYRDRFPRGFILIDWAGAIVRGYPFANLLRIAQTSRMSASVLRAELVRHCNILSCETRDIMPYLLAAVGFVGANLGYFAEDDYLSMYEKTIQFALAAARSLESSPSKF